MKKYKLRIGLDVDDVLYDCNSYALSWLNKEEGYDPPLTIHDIRSWGVGKSPVDGRLKYFNDPDFVRSQPMLPGAAEFVRKLTEVADVFFVTAVPPRLHVCPRAAPAAGFPRGACRAHSDRHAQGYGESGYSAG